MGAAVGAALPDALLATVRAAHFAATIVVFGEFVFAVFVAPGRVLPARFRGVSAWGLAVLLASALAWLALEAVSMSGLPAKEALSPAVLGTVATQTHYGHLWLARICAGAVLAVMLAASRGAVLLWSGIALSALLLATLAGMGHAGSGQGLAGAAHLGIDAAHLLAAGAWLGALVPFVLVVRAAARGDDAQRRFAAEATKRFSTLGVASMAVIAVSGVANSCYMLPTLSALVSSPYGRWLYAKIVLFLVILIIAATNRLQLTPRLVPAAASRPAFRELTRNALAECLLGFSIVALVGELGITVPGHMQ